MGERERFSGGQERERGKADGYSAEAAALAGETAAAAAVATTGEEMKGPENTVCLAPSLQDSTEVAWNEKRK